MKYYIPPTQQQDFRDQLATDVPHANYDFELIRNWYAREGEDYEPVHLRALYYPINWKSKIGNSDTNSNFKTSYDVRIREGNIVIRMDNRQIYMLNWQVQHLPNNQTTQAIDYNAMLTFERHRDGQVDDRGFLIREAFDEVIAPSIPCSIPSIRGVSIMRLATTRRASRQIIC